MRVAPDSPNAVTRYQPSYTPHGSGHTARTWPASLWQATCVEQDYVHSRAAGKRPVMWIDSLPA